MTGRKGSPLRLAFIASVGRSVRKGVGSQNRDRSEKVSRKGMREKAA